MNNKRERNNMNAVEVIEKIKQLPLEEKQKVIAYVFEMVTEADLSDDFKRSTDETFAAVKSDSWVSGFAQ